MSFLATSFADEGPGQCLEVRTNGGIILTGIAQGTARCSVLGLANQDLTFFAGEQIVLLERLQGGLCMGFCEGSVGRFREQDVDFAPSTNSPQGAMPASPSLSPSLSPSSSLSPSPSTCLSCPSSATDAAPPLPILAHDTSIPTKPRPRRSSQSSGASEEKTFAPAQSANSHLGSTSTRPVLARDTAVSSMVLSPSRAGALAAAAMAAAAAEESSQESEPWKPMSEENLKRATSQSNTPRRLALSSPSAFNQSSAPMNRQTLSSSRPTSITDLSGRYYASGAPSAHYPKSVIRNNGSTSLLSPPTQSTASLVADLGNSSSATITTNMLGIKSHVFKSHIFKSQVLIQQDHQQPRLAPQSIVPFYQLSTPLSSTNSLSSRPVSPVNSDKSTKPSSTQSIALVKAELSGPNDNVRARSRPGTPTCIQRQPSTSRSSHKRPSRVKTDKDAASSSSSLASPSLESPDTTKDHLSQYQDHYFTNVFDDLRSKTQNVLRKAVFSIAPEAGLFTDRGSNKYTDLKVVRTPPVPAVTAAAATTVTTDTSSVKEVTGRGIGFFRPRSRSVKERLPLPADAQIAQIPRPPNSSPTPNRSSVAAASTISSTSSSQSSGTLSAFKLDRLRHWNMSDWGGHKRASSGPARHPDMVLGQQRVGEMEDSRLVGQNAHTKRERHSYLAPLPPLPPLLPKAMIEASLSGAGGMGEAKKKKKVHRRRMSDATMITIASTQSASANPQRFQIQQSQGQQQMPSGLGSGFPPQPERQQRSMSNWFGMGKRRSIYSLEDDPKKPHPLGNGIEGGVDSRPPGWLMEGDDFEEDLFDDSDCDEDEQDPPQHKQHDAVVGVGLVAEDPPSSTGSSEKKGVVVNNYGFILEDNVDESGKGYQESLESAASSIVGDVASKLDSTFLSEHERKRAMKKQQENYRISEAKWFHAITRLEPEQVKKSSKFKKLTKRGIPASVRGRVWQFLANSSRYREPGVFQELLARGHIPIHDEIANDIDRCYPDHVHFRKGMGGTGQEDLHAILNAYAHYNPSVGYCQGMGRLVGMMLMQMPVEEAFWLLVATIEGYLSEHFTPTLRQLHIDAQVFERLLEDQDPKLAQHLQRNEVTPIVFIPQWFLTLFTMSLPWASVLRVWDLFYFDGVKTLFRVGLAVLQICRQHLLENCPSNSECMAYLLHVPLDILGPEVLLERTAYRIRLRREHIERMSALTAGGMPVAGSSNGGTVAVEQQARKIKKSEGHVGEEDDEQRVKIGAGEPRIPVISFKEVQAMSGSPMDPPSPPATFTTTSSRTSDAMITVTTTTATTTTTPTTNLINDHNANNCNANDLNTMRTSAVEGTGAGTITNYTGGNNDNAMSVDKVSGNEQAERPRPYSQPPGPRSFIMSTLGPSPPGIERSRPISIHCSTLTPIPPPSTAAPSSLSSSISGFSPLSVFKTRKRAGTMNR